MLNDGKCDRRGRYWCASVHSDFIGRQAELFRLDPDLTARRIDGGFIIGNGIAFSPDDRRMYFADSRDETVWVYDFDLDSGSVSNRRVFFSTADIEGRVDGATCDSDGNYWCALVHGGAVACISPEGRMIRRIEVPATASDHGRVRRRRSRPALRHQRQQPAEAGGASRVAACRQAVPDRWTRRARHGRASVRRRFFRFPADDDKKY